MPLFAPGGEAQRGQGTLFALCYIRIAAPAAPLFSLAAGRADAGPARADPYHARGRHEFMHRYLEDQGCAGFDDDFDGWVAL